MSGIAGVCLFQGGRVEARDVEMMLDSIAHRGPDRAGICGLGSAMFGHRMLLTTAESFNEKMPLIGRTGTILLTSDARIDNRDELIHQFGLFGRPVVEISDGELILRAFEKWGKASPEKLIGDFAFAVWDAQREEIFSARDPMGVRPFYYYRFDDVFVFASEIKALLRFPRVPRRLNEEKVADYVALLDGDGETTFYRDICQLPAASGLLVTAAGMIKQRSWKPDPKHELSLSSTEDYVEGLREVFGEAVRCRLRSTSPVASMLSGGLDSSSIVGVPRQLLKVNGAPKLHTYSAIFPTLAKQYPRIDERKWIDAVVAQGGVEPHYLEADPVDPLAAMISFSDEPLAAPNMYLDWICFQATRDQGNRVMLTGTDGDTVISYAFGYFADLASGFRWRKLLEEARALFQANE